MIVELSAGKVEVIDSITWGQQEQIRAAMMGGIKVQGLSDKERQEMALDAEVIIRAKYKALEICVKKITLPDGTEKTYSKEWMDNLSIEDGDNLFAVVNEVTNPNKKK